MKSICIYASELAVVLGINKYQKISDVILKLWQKNFAIDYENTLTNMRKKYKVEYIPKESDMQKLKRIQDDSDINVQDKVQQCMQTKNKDDLIKNRTELLKEINANENIASSVKKEFKESLESMTNKVFGTINEKSVIQFYSEKYNKNVISYTKFIRKELCVYKDIRWSIGGKIDGLTEDGIVIEIKNRIYKLFGTMRDYEKPQLQSYMYIMDHSKGHLVESLKRTNSIEMNVIEENFDSEYWNNIVLSKLNNFIKLFHLFLDDIDLKTYILLSDDDDKDEQLLKFI